MQVLAGCAERININGEIMALYLEQLLPGITAPEDDGNYGSAACYDVLCLQASRACGMLSSGNIDCASQSGL